MTAVTPKLLAACTDGLARAKSAGAMAFVSQYTMDLMGDAVDKVVTGRLARVLLPRVEEIAERGEVIDVSPETGTGPYGIGTTFRADVVLMKPSDYRALCELVRRLSTEGS